MSKESFSKKVNELMYLKFKSLEYEHLDYFFKKDENFELVLCLAYMTLSKEKIIKKDMKNTNRIERLTQMVDTAEIDKVFKEGFADKMPEIYFAQENNNLWILDNIRDSIMHGVFDIDEENECFIINNTQHDRQLSAKIPFSWFIAYAKNDILSKKIADKYTISHFYYNNNKKYKRDFNANKEVINNILYKVNITGNKFNVKDIEKRIVELFDLYSSDKISDELIENYRDKINLEPIKYNEKYLVSFYIAQEKVKEQIEKEFDGVSVKIFINSNKHKLSNKAERKLLKKYPNYDLMFIELERLVAPKSNQLLKCISNIIENIDNINNIDLQNDSTYNLNLLNKYVYGDSKDFFNKYTLKILSNDIIKTLKQISLISHGLSTLVINHENLYSKHFTDVDPKSYNIFGISKKDYLDFAQKRKVLILKILDIDILLFDKNKQLNNCTNESIKEKIQSIIDDLENSKQLLEKELTILSQEIDSRIYIKRNEVDVQKKENLIINFNAFFQHFEQANNTKDKKQIKKIIGNLFDAEIEENSKYTYCYCKNMDEVLTIIRNCFSHIGRITFGKNNGHDTIINLNDYDNNNEKSGEVTCRYFDLIKLLGTPYLYDEYEVSHEIKK